MPYFPMVAEATVKRRYSFGEYRALLLGDIRSVQRIQYYFVFAVFRGTEEMPCLAVASEYSDEESAAAPFLGVFPGEGHVNMGNSRDWLNLETFASEAVRVSLAHLKLPPDQQVVVEEVRKKPWWKFW